MSMLHSHKLVYVQRSWN